MKVKIKKLDPAAVIPSYSVEGDAAMDLTAVAEVSQDQVSGIMTYRTGLAVEIPTGHVGLIFPRSSISKTSVRLTNAVGVIDSGYRGEILVKFDMSAAALSHVVMDIANLEEKHFLKQFSDGNPIYKKGDRIAQLMIIPIPTVEFEEVTELLDSNRGEGSFGSTGK